MFMVHYYKTLHDRGEIQLYIDFNFGYFLKKFEGVNIKVVLKEDYFKEY